MHLYRNESSYPKVNAQRNLSGRTHYVDDDTLRFHKSRVLSCHITDGGLLLAIVCSDALNYEGTKRGFRYTIFDVFGTAQERLSLDEAYSTKAKCLKAMWNALNKLDAHKITKAAIDSAERNHASEMNEMRHTLKNLVIKNYTITAYPRADSDKIDSRVYRNETLMAVCETEEQAKAWIRGQS